MDGWRHESFLGGVLGHLPYQKNICEMYGLLNAISCIAFNV